MSNPAAAEPDPQEPPDPARNPEPVELEEDWEGDWDDSDEDEWEEPDSDAVLTTPVPVKPGERTGYWDEWLRPTHGEVETYTDQARKNFRDLTGGNVPPIIGGRPSRKRHEDEDEVHTLYPRRGLLLWLGGAALGLVIFTIVLINLKMAGRVPSGPAPAAASHPTTSAKVTTAAATTVENYPHATADCYATRTADNVVGAGPGDPSTATGAILGFEWAYYSDRSGARARDWVAANATVPDADHIQAGIDSTPVATKYCVHITRADSDATSSTWNVVLSEQYPTDKTPQQWHQTITTIGEGGRFLITSIRKAD